MKTFKIYSKSKLDELARKIKKELLTAFQNRLQEPDMGFPKQAKDRWDIGVDDIVSDKTIDVIARDDGIYIEVRAELGYDTLADEIVPVLDEIIKKYDKEAYFDFIDSTSLGTFLYAEDLTQNVSSNIDMNKKEEITGAIEPPIDPPEEDEPDEVDADDYLDIEFKDQVEVYEDGSIFFKGDEIPDWAKNPDERSGFWMSEEYPDLILADGEEILDDIQEILVQYIPSDVGTYRVTGEATLHYNITGIDKYDAYSGKDEDGKPIIDYDYGTDRADVKFDFENSYISNFTSRKISNHVSDI